jgi:hypothetical protein
MKRIAIVFSLVISGLFINPLQSRAQKTEKQATVEIAGEVIKPLVINIDSLNKFKQTEVVRKDRDGKNHTYSGVILADILQKVGVSLGKELRGENLTKYALITASDGYQVVFALAELDKDFTDRTIILADTIDGKPLAPGDGPFRIIVQDEKKPARCIKQVTGIKIIFAK